MKTIYKVAFTTLLLGWFPFMWLAVWGSWDREIGVIILCIGIFFCFVGSVCFLALSTNKVFWMKLDEANEYIEKHKESIRLYEEAKEKLIKKTLES
jgi:hypothetical protein